jgi:hypothetical protein
MLLFVAPAVSYTIRSLLRPSSIDHRGNDISSLESNYSTFKVRSVPDGTFRIVRYETFGGDCSAMWLTVVDGIRTREEAETLMAEKANSYDKTYYKESQRIIKEHYADSPNNYRYC